MLRKSNPTAVAPPYKNIYSHTVEVPAGSRLVFTSGQLGIAPDGSISPDFKVQAEQVMKNLAALLAHHGVGVEALVRINAYVLARAQIPLLAQARAAWLGNARPAMTTVVVSGLAAPDWLVEVEVVFSVEEARP